VWDRDRVSSDDIIGVVYIDLANLLGSNSGTPLLSSEGGWFPIFDTIRGNSTSFSLSISSISAFIS
jgi:hypothetical protein